MVIIVMGQVVGIIKEGKLLLFYVCIWDLVFFFILYVLGLGVFDRVVCCVGFFKFNGGNLLCVVDEFNDYMFLVWDWVKEIKVVDVKCFNEVVLVVIFYFMDFIVFIICGKFYIYFWILEGGSLSKW